MFCYETCGYGMCTNMMSRHAMHIVITSGHYRLTSQTAVDTLDSFKGATTPVFLVTR